MGSHTLTSGQSEIASAPLDSRVFLSGPAGSGKTTAAVERALYLMTQGVPGDSILVLLPQRTLAKPYDDAFRHPGVINGGAPIILTAGGLAQRMVDLYWPLVAGSAGFAHPEAPPTYLTLETAQYVMARLTRPLLEQGYFESAVISPNRLYSQILDNLNKAAVVGFPMHEIGERLKSSWMGKSSQLRIFSDAQDCANRFRDYCLAHNLLDFSLQVEVFKNCLWLEPLCRQNLQDTYSHLIFDNIEEDTPFAHDLVRDWLPDFQSALLVMDDDAGYRLFLGADSTSALSLQAACPLQARFETSFTSKLEVEAFSQALARAAKWETTRQASPAALHKGLSLELASHGFIIGQHRYFPEMLDWVTGQARKLVEEEGVAPGEIAILSPFLSDALRFSLLSRLEQAGLPARSHRPSRALHDEPAVQCLLTFAMLAHPAWGACPSKFDVAYALMQAIDGLDLVRAQILAEVVYQVKDKCPRLSSFDQIQPAMQERITYLMGERYERLRIWLEDFGLEEPVEFDFFLSRLFGERLSQPGYGFHRNLKSAEAAYNLIESARKFRWAAAGIFDVENLVGQDEPQVAETPLALEYLRMVQDGVVAAQYVRSWQVDDREAVLLAPAYTFLLSNRPVKVQFWLDIGSRGWFERLYQPLTHPHVLSRNWQPARSWTDADEVIANEDALYRLVLGLARRCSEKIYLASSELGEQGYEQQGQLLKVLQRLLRWMSRQAQSKEQE